MDARGWKIPPDNFGSDELEIVRAATTVFDDMITVLHEATAWFENSADFFGERICLRLGKI